MKKELAPSLRAIEQLSAQRLLSELKLRRDAGQHRLVADGLKRFPAEGVGGEILQGVREMIQQCDTREARRQNVVKDLKALAARIPDTIARENLKPILDEIAAEIGPNTLDRMAAFLQNADDSRRPRRRSSRWPLAAGCWGPIRPRTSWPRRFPPTRSAGWCAITSTGRPVPIAIARTATSRWSRAASRRWWPNCWPT